MRMLFALVVAILVATSASANPIPATSQNFSGTITTTNTFQSVQAQNNGRFGCTLQNGGTHTMYVYFGSCANATTGASAQLFPGQPVRCLVGNGYVLRDQVCITGTSGDAFFANFQ